ncbi:hypothetical protein FSP39_015994 [Pinctada imbricata]|uniref:VPS10 domain-containing protein n=1 Tax=Pinctada imbricata TaxID=66713 RepID=A0AA88YSF5_PINIB|nr:hypothetical protein FSP39_015994 [Pinctada imbricata]
MIVHWAGYGSDVIIALSKDSRPNNLSSSNLFISYDYGYSFEDVNSRIQVPGRKTLIDHYYNSHVYNSHYIFTDVENSYIFTTLNYGRTFTPHHLPFRPVKIEMHTTNFSLVLGYDKNDTQKRLYLSENFGFTWRPIQSGVKSYHWGSDKYNESTVLYVARTASDIADIGGEVVKSYDFFRHTERVITNIVDFHMEGDYMFATRQVNLFGARSPVMQLWVSYKRGPFVNAQFSHPAQRLDYYVADASEDQVFLVVTHNNTVNHLYISDVQGSRYSLSLESVVYFNPKGSQGNSWLRYFAKERFADITKIQGLKGVYIASQVNMSAHSLSATNQRSFITFDKGGEWFPLQAPEETLAGIKTNCTNRFDRKHPNCSLHLTQEFSHLYPGGRTVPIMSRESAPGIVIATGSIGKSLKRNPDVFLSTDAGFTWKMFHCKAHQPKCVPMTSRCNGEADCGDRSDEANCTQTECPDYKFNCGDGRCIYKSWICDHEKDCSDGRDEVNCSELNFFIIMIIIYHPLTS